MPDIRIIGLPMHDDSEMVQAILDTGATVFYTKKGEIGTPIAEILG